MLKNLDDEQKLNLAFIGSCLKGLAHNINTPLSAIMGRSEMLQMRFNRIKSRADSGIDKEELEKCIKDIALILENSAKVSETVKNAMKKSINAESVKVQLIRLDTLLKDELEFLKADMYFKHNIEKTYDIPESIPPLKGVYVHFSNSFFEILENCKQAMLNSDEKKLLVFMGCDDRTIEIRFHDTGCGFDPVTREHMLDMLCTTSEKGDLPATVTGMQRVARLLRPYNAQFHIQSMPGDTTFTMKIPLQKDKNI
ncbi:MAG: HAMP domain-containing sensor histidine kinase [Pseudomonadota bacterium]